MALDKVVEDIIDKARRESDALIEGAEEERERILKEIEEKSLEMRRVQEKELDETLKRLRRQEISSAELEAKKILLNKKKELLDRAFEETLDELSSMPPADKRRIYHKSIDMARGVISKPNVYCPMGEAKILSGEEGLASVNEVDMGAGLVMESEDGSIRVDYRFRTMLEDIWERELRNISDILFE